MVVIVLHLSLQKSSSKCFNKIWMKAKLQFKGQAFQWLGEIAVHPWW